MALVQSQQFTGSGLGVILRPLLHLKQGTRNGGTRRQGTGKPGFVVSHPFAGRPRKDGAPTNWLRGMMEQDLHNTIALLTRTPAVVDALLRGLADVWTQSNEGENTWNATAVVAHLIHCEVEDWLPRAKIILQWGEAQRFEPFDREGYMRYGRGKTLSQLLDEFAQLRARNLDELRALRLSAEGLKRRGIHPGLGSVTLSELLAAWAAHDLTHLHQIARVMAHQYREAAGPWTKYMGVMQCGGRSSAA